MAQCSVCGKKAIFGNSISHSHRVTRRIWRPNIQQVKAFQEGQMKRVSVCTSCLKAGKIKKG
ncbi:MAG TPA: 50S ribosomal protein L28 [Atribacteraceae bacterium]|nr:50S ribosomal protein L28 [Atribacteraceae bacterium]